MLDCSTHFEDLAGGQELHFNLQFINKNMYGKIKHTIRMGTEWATFCYVNQDQSMNVARFGKRESKNGSQLQGRSPPTLGGE